jgi:PTS system galactitol-specific IIA component
MRQRVDPPTLQRAVCTPEALGYAPFVSDAALLCIVRLDVPSAEGAVRALARELYGAGHVKGSFEAAAVAREKRSPTGLPFEGGAVALPHAEPEHVLTPALGVATLARPVKFREMGSPATQLDVALVVMPALTAKEQATAGLTKLIEMLQDKDLRAALAGAGDTEAMRAALAPALAARG